MGDSFAQLLEAALEKWEQTPGGAEPTTLFLLPLPLLASARTGLLIAWELSSQYGKLRRALEWSREFSASGGLDPMQLGPNPWRAFQYLLASDQPEAARAVLERDYPMAEPHHGRAFWYWWSAYTDVGFEQEMARWQEDRALRESADGFNVLLWAIFGRALFARGAVAAGGASERAGLVAQAGTELERAASIMSAASGGLTAFEAPMQLHRADQAQLRGDPREARALLEPLGRDLHPESGAVYHAAALRRLGELDGGERGEQRIAQADARMRELGFLRPDRWAAVFTPSFEALRR